MTVLTAGFIRSILDYDAATGWFIWRPRSDIPRKISIKVEGKRAEKLTHRFGYRTIVINKRGYFAHRLAWLHHYGAWPDTDIDHIDGEPDNNAILNLRRASKSENQHNRPAQKNNKSGYKGVFWNSQHGCWTAKITVNGKKKHLGLFDSAAAAAEVYRAASIEMLGEFSPFT